MNQKTCLYQEHVSLGAKLCPFAGYEMPIQYPHGVLQEHAWVRSHAGLFDVSHMGQAIVSGAEAAAFLSGLTPSSFLATPAGLAKYTVLTNAHGGIIDDLIITRLAPDRFFLVINAARKEIDLAWMRARLPADVTLEPLTDRALIALQGPEAEAVLVAEFPQANLADLGYMRLREATWQGVPVFISRLGYTGEDGFEISIPVDQAGAFWRRLLADARVWPIGLAARDSLRLEMGYPLYGHDLDEETSPVEASLAWVIGKEHRTFTGAETVLSQHASGVSRKRVGIRLTESGIAREGAAIYAGATRIGTLTSGGFSPSLKASIGQGYVTAALAQEGQKIEVEVRGKRIPAVIHGLSFVEAKTKRSVKKG